LRYINTAQPDSAFGRELLDVFAMELLHVRSARAEHVAYLVSPWMGDVQLTLDGRGYFADLFPGQSHIAFQELLKRYMELGGRLRLVLRCYPDRARWDEPILATVRLARELWKGHAGRMEVRCFSDLHTKLFVGHTAGLMGSANFTPSGVGYNKELLQYVTDEAGVARLRQEAEAIFAATRGRVREQPILEGS